MVGLSFYLYLLIIASVLYIHVHVVYFHVSPHNVDTYGVDRPLYRLIGSHRGL